MADEENQQEASSGGGGKKMILMIIIGVILIGASVGGTIAVMSMFNEPPPAPTEDADAEPVPEVKKQAIYYPLKPEILVNYEAKGRQRFLQAEITLLVREQDVIAAIELHMPMIRNALVMLIGGQTYEEIQSAEGKEFMRIQALEELQRIFEKEIGKPGVEQVLFTNLVMQ